MAAVLPTLNELKDMCVMLYGHDTRCVSLKAQLPIEECAVISQYRDNDGIVKRILACDLPFGISMGAALSMIPSGAVAQLIQSGQIPENIMANLNEVMNIAVGLFTASFGERLQLDSVLSKAEVTDEIKATLGSGKLPTYEVTISRYPSGRVAWLATQ